MEIKTKLIPITHLNSMSHGYANGYIGVPPEHPWYNQDYNHIDADVHGGLTYSCYVLPNNSGEGYWWLGFDTIHYGDNKFNCDKTYCEQQLEFLKQQAINAMTAN
jgi:hypothetical protein